jgi:hypothetical protein
MVKKISILLLVAVVLTTGYISLRKLNYWNRSVMIFKMNSSEQSFQGRGGRNGRGFGEFEGREPGSRRPEFREGMQRPEGRNIPDSLRRRFEGRGQFEGRRQGGDRNEGRDFRRGKAVNLNLVIYYLAVFALFTLIMVYLEKGYRLIFRRKNKIQENSDLVI